MTGRELKLKSKRFWAAGIAASIVAVTGCSPGASSQGNDDPVKVGLSAQFSGAQAYFGEDSKKGAELALEKLKKTMPDTKFELATADDECTVQGGVAAFRRLTDVDNVDVILGSACSSGTLGGMPTLMNSKVPAMTFGATNAKITEQAGVGGNPYMWRMNLNDQIIGQIWTKYIANAGNKTLAILAINNDFGKGANDVYAKLAPEAGMKLATSQFFDPGTSDFRPQLTQISSSGSDAVMIIGEAPDCGLIMRQMHETGLKLPIFSRAGCSDPIAIKATGDPKIAEGAKDALYWASTDSQKELLDAWARDNEEPIPYLAALAYYGMLTLAEAVKAGGTTPEGIQKGLREVDFKTDIGPIKFDDHNQAHPDLFIVEAKDGRPQVLETVSTGQ